MDKAIIEQIEKELKRLAVDNEVNPYSGLTLSDEDGDLIELTDDYIVATYCPQSLLRVLRQLEYASLDSKSPSNIWGLIESAERLS